MTISRSHKTPRGYSRQPVIQFLELSQGERPSMPIAPASYLPVVQQDTITNEWYVILAGKIVAFNSSGDLVLANGGAAQTVTYTTNDVSYTVDIDDTTSLVAAAGAASTQIAANKPSGWSFYHWYSSAIEDRNYNYILQPNVAVLCDYFISVPLKLTAQDTFASGDLVMPNATGDPIPFTGSSVTDVEQICGRATWVGTAVADTGLNLVRTLKGAGLAGVDTGGMLPHLYGTHEDTTAIDTELKINITLL